MSRALPNSTGLISGESERRLSGVGVLNARADHAAASRSSDGSGKITRANALLAEQRAGLEAAIAALSCDRLAVFDLNVARRMLAKVASFEADMARAPEFNAPLVLGFMGENGWAPLIRLISSKALPAIRYDLGRDVA